MEIPSAGIGLSQGVPTGMLLVFWAGQTRPLPAKDRVSPHLLGQPEMSPAVCSESPVRYTGVCTGAEIYVVRDVEAAQHPSGGGLRERQTRACQNAVFTAQRR